MKQIKIIVLGDGGVGKTSLLQTYSSNVFPTEYIPTLFDDYSMNIMFENIPINLKLFDTAGQDDYLRLRKEIYKDIDLFLFCFSLISPKTLDDIETYWIQELKFFNKKPFFLVGLKCDLRDEFSWDKNNYIYERIEPISKEKGAEIAKKIKEEKYIERSSLKYVNLDDVFESAVQIILHQQNENMHT